MTSSAAADPAGARPLVLAFYLPQFHPVPENDAWWGPGFSEWTNVVQATPLFEGHYQPHLPADLGFYDLRVPEVRERQASLAAAHGIDGFCYYHYWFGGRRILERPFREVLESGQPVLPFMLCWANENWTRAWDGGPQQWLLEQTYAAEEREEHIAYLVDVFGDERYLRLDGRPMFAIYRIGTVPDAAGFAADLRAASIAAGVGDPLLIKFDTFGDFEDPAVAGFDVAAQFFPHGTTEMGLEERRLPLGTEDTMVFAYDDVVQAYAELEAPEWTRYECVIPCWDNTPRRTDGRSLLVHGSTPDAYEGWLRTAVERAGARATGPPVVFVNAWNEWAEGAHLEPDLRWGDGYLRATARAVLGHEPAPPMGAPPPPAELPPIPSAGALYEDLFQRYVLLQERLSAVELAAQRRLDHALAPLREELDEQRSLVHRLTEQLSRLRDPVPDVAEASDPLPEP